LTSHFGSQDLNIPVHLRFLIRLHAFRDAEGNLNFTEDAELDDDDMKSMHESIFGDDGI
jgi:hypothetical protein